MNDYAALCYYKASGLLVPDTQSDMILFSFFAHQDYSLGWSKMHHKSMAFITPVQCL